MASDATSEDQAAVLSRTWRVKSQISVPRALIPSAAGLLWHTILLASSRVLTNQHGSSPHARGKCSTQNS